MALTSSRPGAKKSLSYLGATTSRARMSFTPCHNTKTTIDLMPAAGYACNMTRTGTGKSVLVAILAGLRSTGLVLCISTSMKLAEHDARRLARHKVPTVIFRGDMSSTDRKLAYALLSSSPQSVGCVYVSPEYLISLRICARSCQGPCEPNARAHHHR